MITSIDIANAYQALQAPEVSAEPAHWVRYIEMTRFDPRVGEMLILFIRDHFRSMNPISLNHLIQTTRQPATLGVLLEHVSLLITVSKERTQFSLWKQLALAHIEKAPYQSFFIGLSPFSPKQQLKAASLPLSIYSKWGFYAQDLMINKARQWLDQHPRTLIDADQRKEVLNQLIVEQERIRAEDYIHALKGMVSRRQAEMDLSRHPKLIKKGQTRNAFWVKANRSPH